MYEWPGRANSSRSAELGGIGHLEGAGGVDRHVDRRLRRVRHAAGRLDGARREARHGSESSSGLARPRRDRLASDPDAHPPITSRPDRAGRAAGARRPRRAPAYAMLNVFPARRRRRLRRHRRLHLPARRRARPPVRARRRRPRRLRRRRPVPDERARARRSFAGRAGPDDRPDREQPDRAAALRPEPGRLRDRGAGRGRHDALHRRLHVPARPWRPGSARCARRATSTSTSGSRCAA